jgi:hypothetical protein
MSLRTIYKIHKWMAVIAGIFFLMWLISGIVMILPPLFFAPVRKLAPKSFDYRKVTVSPAEAVITLEESLEKPLQVQSVALQQIVDRAVYTIMSQHGESYLINAQSGQRFTITPEVAEQIAREYVPSQARVVQSELVNRHSFSYQWGPLPAYRLVFDSDRSTGYYVSAYEGTVRRSTLEDRLRGAIGSLHTFEPIKLITTQVVVHKGLIILLSLVGVGVAITGYYLALPRLKAS